jgi:DNA gyrase subunit A
LEIIRTELTEIKEKFGDERRTEITSEVGDLDLEDLIAEEDMVITVSHAGYVKRCPVSTYRKQHRGGKGITGAETKEEDFIERLFVASTHDYMLIFTNKGKLHWLKVHELPQVGRRTKGRPIVNLLNLNEGELVKTIVPVREFKEDQYVVMATENGKIKKTVLTAFSNPRKGGIIAITLDGSDNLIGAQLSGGHDEICLATRNGKAIRFKEENIRPMGRSAQGVKGITLKKEDKVIGMVTSERDSAILTVTKQGYGKRTDFEQYRLQTRGGSGVINMKIVEKNGPVVGVKNVLDDDEIMLITKSGMIVRAAVSGISKIGRSTQGVRVIRTNAGDELISIAKVITKEEDEVTASIDKAADITKEESAPAEEKQEE